MKKTKLKHFDEYLYTKQLDNGIKLMIYPITITSDFAVYHTFHVGSNVLDYKKDNKIYSVKPGLAHFFEHCKFHRKDDKDYFDLFKKYDLYVNAFTSSNVTSYEFKGYKNIYEGLDLLKEMTTTAAYTKESLEKEKGIVVAEIKRYDSDVDASIRKFTNDIIYTSKNYKSETIGNEESVRSITLEDMNRFNEDFYNLNNSEILIIGNVDVEEITKHIEKIYPKTNNYIKAEPIIEEETKELEHKIKTFESYLVERPRDYFAIKTNLKKSAYNYHVLQFLHFSLFNTHTPFFEKFVNNQLGTSLRKSYFFEDDILFFNFSLYTDDYKAFIDEIISVFENTEITEEDLTLFKRVKKSEFIRESDSVDMMDYNLMFDMYFSKIFEEDYDKHINNITVEEANKIRKQINFRKSVHIKIRKKED